MKLKTIDTIKKGNETLFKIKKDENNTLYIDNDILFLMLKYLESEYKENKKIIIDELKIELDQRTEKLNNRWKI